MLTTKRNGTKRKLQTKHNPIEKATPGMTAPVSIEDATIFIAERVQQHGEKIGDVIDKVRKVIRYAIRTRRLATVADQSIQFLTLITWINTKNRWREKFKDLPTAQEGEVSMALPAATLVVVGTTLPMTLEDCHALLCKATTEKFHADQEIAHLKGALASLDPAKNAYQKRKHDGGVNGKKGGRGKSK